MKKTASASDPLWYKDAVIYELHVRAFADSNGDGIGDFPGLISKLDYLQDLGVTCLWLLPFFPSPLRDDGYDIADYVSVNPSYGTIEDFQRFLDAAHARGMQVMIELVINHSSDQHPWFKRARISPKGSPEREMYVWSDTDKLFDGVRIIFTDTEKSNWTWDEVAGQYYWHRFFSHQPDLNFDNPRVMEEVLKAMRFWLDMGVDALRLDAIPYLVERDGTSCENVPETHVKIKEIRAVIDAEYDNRLILAEANMWPADVRPYFGDGDECHMAFHFPLMPRIYMALRQEDRLPITDIMAQTPPIPPACQWGLFLRNHDELTLEMVTDDERDYMNLAYASDPRMRVNVGIRRRLAPLVDNNRRRIELLNSLLLSFPGTPILYYGDEIGMGDNIYLGDRNGVRTPMQWNSDRNAGFSKAVPAKLYFPVIMDPVWGYQAINVEAQESDPSSLLHWNRNMIALRKLFQVFGRGTLEFLHPENRKVLAYLRQYDAPDGHSETVLCVANLSRFAQPVALDLAKYAGKQPVEMLGYVPFPQITELPYVLSLAPYSFFWLELQEGAGTTMTAEQESRAGAQAAIAAEVESKAPFSHEELTLMQSSLPGYIATQRWFGGKALGINTANVSAMYPVDGIKAVIAVIDVEHCNAGTSRYQLPLAVAEGDDVDRIAEASPKAILQRFERSGKPAAFYDASASPEFRTALMKRITGAETEDKATGLVAGPVTKDVSNLVSLLSKVGSAEQSNTSIIYGDRAIVKLFRHLTPGENPDVEIARFLTNIAKFDGIPAYLGDLHLESDGTTVAFAQEFVKNQGDGWEWTLQQLAAFYASNGAEANYESAAAQIGQLTAQMHLAMATPTDDTAFKSEPFTLDELKQIAERVSLEAKEVMEALPRKLEEMPKETAVLAGEVLRLHDSAFNLASMETADPAQFGQRTRIHGDYHLGQLLRAGDNFKVVDFEGEPARSLEERRRKQSPLKDIAGMLRSFSYAAHSTLDKSSTPDANALAGRWEDAARKAFLQSYWDTLAPQPQLVPRNASTDELLKLLLWEKTLYEVRYELNNRPTWLHIPLRGLLGLLQRQS